MGRKYKLKTKEEILAKNYLASKEESEYNNLDKILVLCLNGEIEKLLSKYEKVRVCPKFYKYSKSIELIKIRYSYQGVNVRLEFNERRYIDEENIGDDFSGFMFTDYPEDFDVEKLIENIESKYINATFVREEVKSRIQRYSVISWIAFFTPIVYYACKAIYCLAMGKKSYGHIELEIIYGTVFVITALSIWLVYDSKAKKLR